MNAVTWVKFSLALAPTLNALVRDLYALTRGDVELSKTVIRRLRVDGYKLEEARGEVDATLRALEQRDKGPAA